MTAFEPPDLTYFAGLQFNPEIYENTLTDSAGALPINPTFNSVRAPIVYTDSIQRDTSNTINLFDAFPSVTSIIIGLQGMLFIFGEWVIAGATISGAGLPAIGFGDGSNDVVFTGVNAYIYGSSAIEMVSGLITDTVMRFEPTFTRLTTSLFEVVQGAVTTIEATATTTNLRNSISTIITTPLFKVVQGALTTIEATEAYTELKNSSYFKFTAPFMYFSPLGTWSAFTASSIRTSFYNPTLVEVYADTNCDFYAPSVSMKLAGANTSSGFDFRTNTSDPSITTSSIVATGGTTTNTGTLTLTAGTSTIAGTTTNLNATTKNIGGTTTNITSTTTNIGGTTLNMNSTTTAFPDATRLTFFSDNGAYPFYDSGRRYILITGATTISNLTTTFDTIFVVPYANGTTFQISLQGVATNINSGNSFRIFNNGSVAITIATTNSTNRLVGPAIARAGTGSYSLASNASVRIQTLIPSSNPFNQTAANAGAYFLSLC